MRDLLDRDVDLAALGLGLRRPGQMDLQQHRIRGDANEQCHCRGFAQTITRELPDCANARRGAALSAMVTRTPQGRPNMTINRMLVGLDFGAASISAARWAKTWFAPRADLILAHVLEPPHRPRFAHDKLPPEDLLESASREYAEARMREIGYYLDAEPIRSEFRIGKPHEELVTLAAETEADLVVIGPHGGRPHTSKFLGTTAERVVRSSPVPVLVATKPPAGTPRRMLVPVDDAEITPVVVETARLLATRFHADVTLLHVWSNAIYSHVASMSYAHAHSDHDAEHEIDEELATAAKHWLTRIANVDDDDEHFTAAVTHGKAGDATIAMADAMHADLIVLGRSSTGVVAPAVLGSAIGTVLHDARCPVLVVTKAVE